MFIYSGQVPTVMRCEVIKCPSLSCRREVGIPISLVPHKNFGRVFEVTKVKAPRVEQFKDFIRYTFVLLCATIVHLCDTFVLPLVHLCAPLCYH